MAEVAVDEEAATSGGKADPAQHAADADADAVDCSDPSEPSTPDVVQRLHVPGDAGYQRTSRETSKHRDAAAAASADSDAAAADGQDVLERGYDSDASSSCGSGGAISIALPATVAPPICEYQETPSTVIVMSPLASIRSVMYNVKAVCRRRSRKPVERFRELTFAAHSFLLQRRNRGGSASETVSDSDSVARSK